LLERICAQGNAEATGRRNSTQALKLVFRGVLGRILGALGALSAGGWRWGWQEGSHGRLSGCAGRLDGLAGVCGGRRCSACRQADGHFGGCTRRLEGLAEILWGCCCASGAAENFSTRRVRGRRRTHVLRSGRSKHAEQSSRTALIRSRCVRLTSISARLDMASNANYWDIEKWARTFPTMIAQFYDQRHREESVKRIAWNVAGPRMPSAGSPDNNVPSTYTSR
jgi:hypothetical protein